MVTSFVCHGWMRVWRHESIAFFSLFICLYPWPAITCTNVTKGNQRSKSPEGHPSHCFTFARSCISAAESATLQTLKKALDQLLEIGCAGRGKNRSSGCEFTIQFLTNRWFSKCVQKYFNYRWNNALFQTHCTNFKFCNISSSLVLSICVFIFHSFQ